MRTNNAREFNWSWPIVSRSKKFKKSPFFLLHYIFANPTRCEVHRTKAHQQLKAFPQISFVIIWKFSERKSRLWERMCNSTKPQQRGFSTCFVSFLLVWVWRYAKAQSLFTTFISIQKTFLVSVNSTNSYYDSAWHLIKIEIFSTYFHY